MSPVDAARAGNQVHYLVATRLVGERPLYRLDPPPKAARAGQKLLFLQGHVAHRVTLIE